MPWTPPIVRAGRYPDGADLEDTYNQIASLTSGWQDYTPAWTSTGTQPSLGNGSLTGRYRWPNESDLLQVQIALVMGSTSTFGTGEYRLSVPVACSAASAADAVGASFIFDANATGRAGIVVFPGSTTTLAVVAATNGTVGATNPQTFVANDQIVIEMRYEPA